MLFLRFCVAVVVVAAVVGSCVVAECGQYEIDSVCQRNNSCFNGAFACSSVQLPDTAFNVKRLTYPPLTHPLSTHTRARTPCAYNQNNASFFPTGNLTPTGRPRSRERSWLASNGLWRSAFSRSVLVMLCIRHNVRSILSGPCGVKWPLVL